MNGRRSLISNLVKTFGCLKKIGTLQIDLFIVVQAYILKKKMMIRLVT